MVARDATEAFEDVGHSDEARALLKDMLVGDFEKTDVRPSFSVSYTLLTFLAKQELKTKGPYSSSSSGSSAVNTAVQQGSKYVLLVVIFTCKLTSFPPA